MAAVIGVSMATRAVGGNNGGVSGKFSFGERGGWWVAAQVLLLLVAFFLAPWTASAAPINPLRYLGALIACIGVAAIFAGLTALGDSLTPFPRPRGDATLVTRGVYRVVRHPIYGGLIALAIGWALWWSSPAGIVYGALVAVFFDRKAAREERWLRDRYPAYAAYARRVRRFVPGVY